MNTKSNKNEDRKHIKKSINLAKDKSNSLGYPIPFNTVCNKKNTDIKKKLERDYNTEGLDPKERSLTTKSCKGRLEKIDPTEYIPENVTPQMDIFFMELNNFKEHYNEHKEPSFGLLPGNLKELAGLIDLIYNKSIFNDSNSASKIRFYSDIWKDFITSLLEYLNNIVYFNASSKTQSLNNQAGRPSDEKSLQSSNHHTINQSNNKYEFHIYKNLRRNSSVSNLSGKCNQERKNRKKSNISDSNQATIQDCYTELEQYKEESLVLKKELESLKSTYEIKVQKILLEKEELNLKLKESKLDSDVKSHKLQDLLITNEQLMSKYNDIVASMESNANMNIANSSNIDEVLIYSHKQLKRDYSLLETENSNLRQSISEKDKELKQSKNKEIMIMRLLYVLKSKGIPVEEILEKEILRNKLPKNFSQEFSKAVTPNPDSKYNDQVHNMSDITNKKEEDLISPNSEVFQSMADALSNNLNNFKLKENDFVLDRGLLTHESLFSNRTEKTVDSIIFYPLTLQNTISSSKPSNVPKLRLDRIYEEFQALNPINEEKEDAKAQLALENVLPSKKYSRNTHKVNKFLTPDANDPNSKVILNSMENELYKTYKNINRNCLDQLDLEQNKDIYKSYGGLDVNFIT